MCEQRRMGFIPSACRVYLAEEGICSGKMTPQTVEGLAVQRQRELGDDNPGGPAVPEAEKLL